jgi:hypothetical protein
MGSCPAVHTAQVTVLVAAFALFVAACGSDDRAESGSATTAPSTASTEAAVEQPSFAELFEPSSLTEDIDDVPCTLADGRETTCRRIVVPSVPDSVDSGPFCPATVDDDNSGIFTWDGDEPGLYALDAAFWSLLDGLGYAFVAEDGSVNIADPADPAGAPAGDSCLEATPDDSYTLAALIPVAPELLDEPTQLDTVAQVGLALDGVTVFGDAPSGTTGAIPALDPCGGHHDPSGYYHWHFGSSSVQGNLDAEDVDRVCAADQDREALFGFAYDGHGIYGPVEDGAPPGGLDACSGHTGETAELGDVYHYHLTEDSPNLPTCLVGAVAEDKLTSPDNPEASLPDSGGPGGADGGPPPGGPPPGGAPPA